MSSNSPAGLASIIVPCCDQRAFTQLCLRALFRHTRRPWELIVVDNGSTDDTARYLAGVQDLSPVPVTIITNASNKGFPAAINQGLKAARGDYLVLLNNDAVVTDGWLDQLVALAEMERDGTTKGTSDTKRDEVRNREGVGVDLVGPMSNHAPPPQLVSGVVYQGLDAMEAFARRWREDHRGRWFRVARLSGFCVLIRRAVYERIGGPDERSGLGLVDDDELAARARAAGFTMAVAKDLFVHHFGGRTSVGNETDGASLLEENAGQFLAGWGLGATAGGPLALQLGSSSPEFLDQTQREFARRVDERRTGDARPAVSLSANGTLAGDGAASGTMASSHHDGGAAARQNTPGARGPSGVLPGRRQVRVALTMIVRDEENNLPRCLESVRGIFDEIVVLDTGSVDRTREIAREFGATVFEFAWIDDFAAARNASLERATGDYVFWLDADDVVEPAQREKMQALLEGLRAGDEAAYVMRCACDPGADGRGGLTVVDHVRLFPLRGDVRWAYRVHEQIMPALRRAGIPVRWSDLTVRHTGYTDTALRARKLDRDARILLEDLKGRPEDPFVLFNLGSIAMDRQDWDGALEFLRRSLARSAPSDSITRKLFALIARALQMRGDAAAALRVCTEGLAIDPEDAELWFRKAVLHRRRSELAEAERCWRRILELNRPEKFASVDMGIYGHLTRRNLAGLAAERGDLAEAERLWRAVLAECPGDREALAKLGLPAANGQRECQAGDRPEG